MAKPTLCMTPTGWFQVAWASDVGVGDVHRMHYFGKDLVAWRSESGVVSVMEAYCAHLGAHLGYGGTVVGENIQCPFHGWQWNAKGRNTCIPYEKHPNLGRKIKSFPTVERNEAIYIWHDVANNEPYFDVPDVFTSWDDGVTAADYHESSLLFQEKLELHPQYVLENGVDFAHFTYVHKVPIVPIFTRQEFEKPISYVDFTVSFDGSATSADEVSSGVEAINCGLGLAVTKSWGMVDNRTATAVTPVDDSTCDVRFSVWIARDSDRGMGQYVIEQFEADLEIWSHQRYTDPAGLSQGEYAGFTALREWAKQFYPEGTTA
ncbi:MAG TPA: Rieske 2Fe-2S domain-containing protein [Nocardioidaceae bacterium]|nr:Rieske 2Fe-2S domain-containing protein [Nocardioidaceae bacterium]